MCVWVLKPADEPVKFRSEQHVLTFGSFHYSTAGYPTVCVCAASLSDTCTHAHPHTQSQMCFAVEGGEQCLQDVADTVQTSVAELGIWLGMSAGQIALNLLNPSDCSGKTGAYFRFTRFTPLLASLCVHVCLCVS